MMGKKAEKPKTRAPASGSKIPKAPGSGMFGGMKSYLIKKFNPDATECAMPDNEEQAYYDENLKRWIFPGDDPAEVAKPLAPPPTLGSIPMEKVNPDVTKDDGPIDPIAAMMAPPPGIRGLSAKKRSGGMGGLYPPGMIGSGPPGMMSPPAAPPAQFAVFTSKPAAEKEKETNTTATNRRLK